MCCILDDGDEAFKPGATASIEAVEVTSEVEPDNELAAALEKYTGWQFQHIVPIRIKCH